MSKGYRGFASKAAYEKYYSDPKNYAGEIPAMEAYTKDAEQEREDLSGALPSQHRGTP